MAESPRTTGCRPLLYTRGAQPRVIKATLRHLRKSILVCSRSPRTSRESQQRRGRNPMEHSASVRLEALSFFSLGNLASFWIRTRETVHGRSELND